MMGGMMLYVAAKRGPGARTRPLYLIIEKAC
jgi:hypothetical protein